VGHSYSQEQNKMVVYFEDGSFREIKEWTKCEVWLGNDFVVGLKERQEQEAGIPIK
jgi:hypothetical protein